TSAGPSAGSPADRSTACSPPASSRVSSSAAGASYLPTPSKLSSTASATAASSHPGGRLPHDDHHRSPRRPMGTQPAHHPGGAGMTAPVVLAGLYERAACAGSNPDLWMPPDDAGAEQIADAYAHARRVCARCTVRVTCLRTVMAQESPSARYGMWAGLTPGERTTLHKC